MDEYLSGIGLDLSDALKAAPALLGYKLIFNSPDGLTSGIIVETEAYQNDDPASHGFRGLGKKITLCLRAMERPMFISLTACTTV